MLSENADKSLDFGATQITAQRSLGWAYRKVWLPKLAYDCLPYFYLTAGFAALFATLYIADWFWILPHYTIFTVACIHMATRLFRLRRRKDSDQQTSNYGSN